MGNFFGAIQLSILGRWSTSILGSNVGLFVVIDNLEWTSLRLHCLSAYSCVVLCDDSKYVTILNVCKSLEIYTTCPTLFSPTLLRLHQLVNSPKLQFQLIVLLDSFGKEGDELLWKLLQIIVGLNNWQFLL